MSIYINSVSAFTPFGNLEQTWKSIVDNKVCYGPITKFDPNASRYTRSKVGGEFHFNAEDYPIITEAERDRLPEHMQWALALASDLDLEGLDPKRTGVVVSPGFVVYLDALRANRENTDGIYHYCPDMSAHNINMKYGFTGASAMVTTACSTGVYSAIWGAMMIEMGMLDNVIVGAVDQTIYEDAYKQMGKLRALSTKYNDTPEIASRPWDTKRDGLVLSEGGALFLLSNQKTDKTICKIDGYAMNNDAYQTVAPNPKGEHVEQCMADTLKGRTPGLINVHATSTPMGDYAELDAINRLGLQDVPICANKSQLGHLMGAAGAVELAVSIMSLKHAIIPPTVNVDEVLEGYSPNIRSKSESHQITSVLCNSFGFGGTNASILIS